MTAVVQRSFCRFCEALCGVVVTTDGTQILSVRGDTDDPLSHGYICPKGRSLGEWHHRPDRLDVPQVRRNGGFDRLGWAEALADLSTRLQQIIDRHGRDAIGLYVATGAAFDANRRRTAD